MKKNIIQGKLKNNDPYFQKKFKELIDTQKSSKTSFKKLKAVQSKEALSADISAKKINMIQKQSSANSKPGGTYRMQKKEVANIIF
jgi:hypothetical protein